MTILVPFVLFMLVLSAFVGRYKNELQDFDKEATIPLRGWLALAVVLGHLDSAMGTPIPFSQHFHWEGPAVSVFFFMSGYGYARSVREKSSLYANGFLRRTCLKLFTPFVICSLVSFLLVGMPESVSSIKLGQVPFLLHSWFVFGLVFLSFVFIVSYRVSGKRVSGYFVCLLWLSTMILYVAFRYILKWPSWWYCSLGAFPLGVSYYVVEPTIKLWMKDMDIRSRVYIFAAIIYGLVALISWVVPRDAPFLSDMPRMLLGVVVVLVLYVLPFRFGYFLGVISYEVYLSHGIFEVCFLRMSLHPILYVCCVLTCTLTFSWFLRKCLFTVSQMGKSKSSKSYIFLGRRK